MVTSIWKAREQVRASVVGKKPAGRRNFLAKQSPPRLVELTPTPPSHSIHLDAVFSATFREKKNAR